MDVEVGYEGAKTGWLEARLLFRGDGGVERSGLHRSGHLPSSRKLQVRAWKVLEALSSIKQSFLPPSPPTFLSLSPSPTRRIDICRYCLQCRHSISPCHSLSANCTRSTPAPWCLTAVLRQPRLPHENVHSHTDPSLPSSACYVSCRHLADSQVVAYTPPCADQQLLRFLENSRTHGKGHHLQSPPSPQPPLHSPRTESTYTVSRLSVIDSPTVQTNIAKAACKEALSSERPAQI